MYSRKIAFGLCVLLLLFSLVSCKEDRETTEETTGQSTDWRNQIEYDGSFYVSKEIKLLYSLDKGSIALWDDGGDGEMLQELSYETAAADAMDNLIREDVNGDGYVDLQTVYSDTGGETSYNLWLWSAADGRYRACSLYRMVKNPQPDPAAGTVSSQYVTEAFGTVVSTYRFTEALELETVSEAISDADEIAGAIALALTGDGTAAPSQGEATVDGVECAAYTVGAGTAGSGAYIAYIPQDAAWYIDAGCLGMYRTVEWNGETYVPGRYIEDAAQVQDLALAYAPEVEYSEIFITAREEGKLGDSSAVAYTVEAEGAVLCRLCQTRLGGWYICTDGTTYFAFTGGEMGEPCEDTFS